MRKKLPDNYYQPGACWAGVGRCNRGALGKPLETCGKPASNYLVVKTQNYAVLRAFMYLCPRHRRRVERAGYTVMPA